MSVRFPPGRHWSREGHNLVLRQWLCDALLLRKLEVRWIHWGLPVVHDHSWFWVILVHIYCGLIHKQVSLVSATVKCNWSHFWVHPISLNPRFRYVEEDWSEEVVGLVHVLRYSDTVLEREVTSLRTSARLFMVLGSSINLCIDFSRNRSAMYSAIVNCKWEIVSCSLHRI